MRAVRNLLLTTVLAATFAAGTAFAQLNVNISLAPPAPMYEPVPVVAPGYAWAPGYWGWNGDRYTWIRGRSIPHRAGYRWDPDRWENRGGHYYRHAGGWARDPGYRVVKVKKDKHFNGPEVWHENGRGHGGKHGEKHGEGHGKGHGKHG